MPRLSRRVQVLMGEREFLHLRRIAQEKHTSIGELLRSGVRMVYFNSPGFSEHRKRHEALKKLFSLHAPVSDWPTMKQEIIGSRFKD